MKNSTTRTDVFKDRMERLEGIFHCLSEPYKVALLAILRHAIQKAKTLHKQSQRRSAQW